VKHKKRVIAGLLLAGCPLLLAQTPPRAQITVERASVGKDGIVYVKWSGRPEQIIPPDRDGYCEDKAHCAAVGADHLNISSNRRSVGWTAEYDSCCQSYPLPWVLVIARNGRVVHSLMAPRPVFYWQVQKGDTRVAVFSNTPHGNTQPYCQLFDTHSWKLIADWYPGKTAVMPVWAKPFAQEVNPDADSSK